MTETLDADVRECGSVPHLSPTTTILRVAAATGRGHLAKKMGADPLHPTSRHELSRERPGVVQELEQLQPAHRGDPSRVLHRHVISHRTAFRRHTVDWAHWIRSRGSPRAWWAIAILRSGKL
jgi:hypothetical protein